MRMTLEFFQTKIAEAKQRSTPILGLDLVSGLGLKGACDQVEEPFVGEYHGGEQKLAGQQMEGVLRNTDRSQQCTRNPDPRTSHAACSGKTGRRLQVTIRPEINSNDFGGFWN